MSTAIQRYEPNCTGGMEEDKHGKWADADTTEMLAEALEALRVWAYDTMAAMDKTVPLELAADVEAALAAVRGEK